MSDKNGVVSPVKEEVKGSERDEIKKDEEKQKDKKLEDLKMFAAPARAAGMN